MPKLAKDAWEKLNKDTDVRLVALMRRLLENKKTLPWLASQLGLSESTPRTWFRKNSFPARDQSRIQELLSLPATFFADIERGLSYEQAVQGRPEQRDQESEQIRASLLRLAQILTIRADETEDQRLARWQQHLRNQVQLISEEKLPPLTPEQELALLDKIEAVIKRR